MKRTPSAVLKTVRRAARKCGVRADELPTKLNDWLSGTALYSPKAWAERGEDYGFDSLLVIVHDGGAFAPLCNYNYCDYVSIEQFNAALKAEGLYVEGCTCWYSAVYAVEDY